MYLERSLRTLVVGIGTWPITERAIASPFSSYTPFSSEANMHPPAVSPSHTCGSGCLKYLSDFLVFRRAPIPPICRMTPGLRTQYVSIPSSTVLLTEVMRENFGG